MGQFLISQRLSNGDQIAVGGFCDPFYKKEILEKCKRIRELDLSGVRDAYFVDYKIASFLNQVLREMREHIILIGASANISSCTEMGGGIIGMLNDEEQSAEGELNYLGDNIWQVGVPGKCGICFTSNKQIAEEVHDLILNETENNLDKSIILSIQNKLKEYITTWLFVSDGCGKSAGSVILHTANEEYIEWV